MRNNSFRIPSPRNLPYWILLFTLLLSIRLHFISEFGSDVPFHDEWDAEGIDIYPKYAAGTLQVRDTIRPFNEHYIIPTYITDIAILTLNKQWDPLLQMITSSIVIALFWTLIARIIAKQTTPLQATSITYLIILLNTPLAGIANLLSGFQSQVAFCILFSIVSMWIATCEMHHKYRIPAIFLVCTLATFSMGPGIFTTLSLLTIGILQLREERSISKFIALALPATLLIPLTILAAPIVKKHQGLGATSIGQFMEVFTRGLAWPNTDYFLWFIPANLPLIILLILIFDRRVKLGSTTKWAIMLATWGAAAAFSMALKRGNHFQLAIGAGTPSRYTEFLAILCLANAIALAAIYNSRTHTTWFIKTTTILWIATFIAGWVKLSSGALEGYWFMQKANFHLREKAVYAIAHEGSSAIMRPGQPHPDANIIRTVIGNPEIKDILPPALQAPIPLQWATGQNTPTVLIKQPPSESPYGIYPVWSSFTTRDARHNTTSISQPFRVEKAGLEMNVLTSPPSAGGYITLSGPRTHRIELQSLPVNEWSTIRLRTPPGNYQLTISEPEGGALMLTEPRELGTLSYYGRLTLEYSNLAIWITSAILLIATQAYIKQESATPRTVRNYT